MFPTESAFGDNPSFDFIYTSKLANSGTTQCRGIFGVKSQGTSWLNYRVCSGGVMYLLQALTSRYRIVTAHGNCRHSLPSPDRCPNITDDHQHSITMLLLTAIVTTHFPLLIVARTALVISGCLFKIPDQLRYSSSQQKLEIVCLSIACRWLSVGDISPTTHQIRERSAALGGRRVYEPSGRHLLIYQQITACLVSLQRAKSSLVVWTSSQCAQTHTNTTISPDSHFSQDF